MSANHSLPLVVDLDGTLIKGDLMQEAAVAFMARNPLNIFRLLLWLLSGLAHFKVQLARHAPPPQVEYLPYNQEFLAYLKKQDRPLILATAAAQPHAEAIANHLGIFQHLLATTNDRNLKGKNKAAALVNLYGDKQFDYAGNSRDDIAIWQRANQPILVNAAPSLTRRYAPAPTFDKQKPRLTTWWKALRPHHWAKNLLIFTVVISGHHILSPPILLAALTAFMVFNLLASATYLINDILDLSYDRRHSKKRYRPLAAGDLGIFLSSTVAIGLYLAALLLAQLLPPDFTIVALLYVVITVAYSLKLKRLLLIDVMILALLFTLRIIAGGMATEIFLTFWLLAFAVFIFLSLAILKRYSELINQPETGRAYQSTDTITVAILGITTGMTAMLILALFINSHTISERYSHPQYIWLAVPLMMYWISRIWILATRGDVGGDPLLFAVRDRISWLVGALLLLLLYLAK